MIESIVIALVQAGVAGAVLAWHLLKTEKSMDKLREAQDRTTRAVLALTLSLPGATETTHAEVRRIYDEMVERDRVVERDAVLERKLAL